MESGTGGESGHMARDKDQKRRWYQARHQEMRDLMWDWDPLGLMGAPEDEYDCVIDRVLSTLVRGADDGDLQATLKEELRHMGLDGYSMSRVELESQDESLSANVSRILSWWRAAPDR
jgi:hypothetical protein